MDEDEFGRDGGSRPATLQSIAAASGVHRSTAARALDARQSHRISADLVVRIRSEAERQGYRRDVTAASLRTGRSKLVGVMLPDLANPVFAPILRGVSAGLADAGYSVIVLDGGVSEDGRLAMVRELVARRVDGLVLAAARRCDRIVGLCIEARLPIVLVNRAEDADRVPAVVSDDIGGMRLAVGHLVSLGHRRIGHIGGPEGLSTGFLRRRGFEAAMSDAGLVADALVTGEAYTREAGEAAACLLLNGYPDVTAICAGNDLLALGAYFELGKRGLRCPQDISIVGHNDMPLVDMVEPPLTTVRIGYLAMGTQTADRLVAEIEGGMAGGSRIVTSAELIVRASTCGPRAVGNILR